MDNEALLAATIGDHWKLQQRLAEGVDIDAQDAAGCTLLHHAASNEQPGVVAGLLSLDADVLLTTHKNNNTALHIAAKRDTEGSTEVTTVLLGYIARSKLRKLLDAKTKGTGNTALHLAAKHGSMRNVMSLLSFGANVEAVNDAGERPIDLATHGEEDNGTRMMLSAAGLGLESAKLGVLKLMRIRGPTDDEPPFVPVQSHANCRNAEGRTILQEFALIGDVEAARRAREVVCMRDREPIGERPPPLKRHDTDQITSNR